MPRSTLPELPHLPQRGKDSSWDQNVSNNPQERRGGSISALGPDVELGRLEEEKPQKMPNAVLPIEERLAFLEERLLQLNPTNGYVSWSVQFLVANSYRRADRTLSEYAHEQISEIDFACYVPKNEIVRISSEDWHEKKSGKFAVPEKSVLTLTSTSRHWAGRLATPDYHSGTEETKETDTPDGDDGDLSPNILVQERPYRLAISGFELHRALEAIFGHPVSLNSNVWIWPFKHFITYESQIRQRLHREIASVGEMENPREKIGASVAFERPEQTTKEAHGADEIDNLEKSEEEQQYESAVRLCGQLECLVQFMDEDMEEIFSVKKSIADGSLRTISFDYLWLLYKPGDLIFSASQRRAYRVLHVTGGRTILDIGDQPSTSNLSKIQSNHSWEQHADQPVTFAHSKNTPFVIDAFYIDFDGEKFGPVPRRFVIQEYEGWQEIDTLPAFPAKFDANMKDTEKTLIRRGKRFIKLAGVSHKKYAGLSAREPSMADYQEEVSGKDYRHK